jgi:hypothetical protein
MSKKEKKEGLTQAELIELCKKNKIPYTGKKKEQMETDLGLKEKKRKKTSSQKLEDADFDNTGAFLSLNDE